MDLVLDLRGFEVGEELALKNLPFDPMHREHEMDPGMDHGGHASHTIMDHVEVMHEGVRQLGDGEEFYVLRMAVVNRVAHGRSVPERSSWA